jgi:hypothetical protein
MTSEERMELWKKIIEANKDKEFALVHMLRDFYTEEGRRKYLSPPHDAESCGSSHTEQHT